MKITKEKVTTVRVKIELDEQEAKDLESELLLYPASERETPMLYALYLKL